MMTTAGTIRPVQPSEREDVARLLSRWTNTSGDYTLRQTFPQVYRANGHANLFGLFDNRRLLSHAAVHQVRLIGPQGAIRTGLIGAVATDPEARGRGLASHLLSEVITWCRTQELDSAMLWSQRWGFYERLGFRPAGRQEEVLLRAQPGSVDPGIRPASVRDIVSILDLHDVKRTRVERNLHDMALLLSIPGMCTMVLERDAEIVAYACYGKGADFPGWWHEMGGTDRDVTTLLCGAMELLSQDRAMVLLPPYRAEFKDLLGTRVVRTCEGSAALRLELTAVGQRDFFIDGLDSI